MFRYKMTAQELIAEQLGHLCSRGVMGCSKEQLSKQRSIGIHQMEHRGSDEHPDPVQAAECSPLAEVRGRLLGQWHPGL